MKQNIVDYLLRYHKLPLKTIVCDFMRDERNYIYFLGVVAFESEMDPLDKSAELFKNQQLNYQCDKENRLVKNYKTWRCRLCLLSYPQAKITKIVTFKLLYKLKENLKKRVGSDQRNGRGKMEENIDYFEHIVNNSYNESQSCRICDLCYTLLITEQEIMEIQRTIALCNHIPIPMDEMMSTANNNPEGLVRSPSVINKVCQWRIMFYFVKFYNFDYSSLPFADGTQVPLKENPDVQDEVMRAIEMVYLY